MEKINFHPLRINDQELLENEYFEIHDDIIRYFHDIFYWVKMYNPSLKKYTNGFCYYGVTIIKGKRNLLKLYSMLNSLIELFNNSPEKIILTGNYCFKEDITKGYYTKLKINKEILINKLKTFSLFSENAVKNNGYILHCGI
ncbi:hypothetical protein ACYULU_10870 [Breznakiellaceae bacterium SP9]